LALDPLRLPAFVADLAAPDIAGRNFSALVALKSGHGTS
jgi:hypothetical protein